MLTADAEADLRGIIRHTRKAWGTDQVRRYVVLLEQAMTRLAAGEARIRDMGDLHPGLRTTHCGHHYLFCLPRDGEPTLVVAILHERRNCWLRPDRQAVIPRVVYAPISRSSGGGAGVAGMAELSICRLECAPGASRLQRDQRTLQQVRHQAKIDRARNVLC